MTNKERLRAVIAAGAEIAGGGVGGALGLVTAGPAGAILLGAGGAAAGRALRQAGEEVSNRLLGPREAIRIGKVLRMAAERIDSQLASGRAVRDDGFFDVDATGHGDGMEVVEGILLKSQREVEERKLPFMANLLANIAFDSTISAARAHQLVKLAEQLTFRQLCLIAVAVHKERFSLRVTDYRGRKRFEPPLLEVLYECADLYQRSLVNFGGEVVFGPGDVKPGSMTIQGLGGDLYNLMQLSHVEGDDVAQLAAVLS